MTLYDFQKDGKGDWKTENDTVMGGRSESQLKMTEDHRAHFSGEVSLENNGGFCSIHKVSEDDPYQINNRYSAFKLTLKGDGKEYKFRVRTPQGKHLYGSPFSTKSGNSFETISIPFSEMSSRYHGKDVDVPNYAGEDVVEMQLLIGNKKEETFEIIIDKIELE